MAQSTLQSNEKQANKNKATKPRKTQKFQTLTEYYKESQGHVSQLQKEKEKKKKRAQTWVTVDIGAAGL